MSTLFERYAGWLWRQHRPLLLAWLLLLGLGIAWLSLNPRTLAENDTIGTRGTDAWQVRETLLQEFDSRIGTSLVVVLPRGVETASLGQRLQARFGQIKRVQTLERTGARHKLLNLELDSAQSQDAIEDLTLPLSAELASWGAERGVKPLLTGHATLQYDAEQASRRDSRQSELIALGLSLVVLVLTFGSLSAALLPLLMGVSALVTLAVTVRLLDWSGNQVSQILTSLLGLALSIDYSLFIVSRFREELQLHTVAEALPRSLVPTGRTILYSGLIMLCSLAALLIPDVNLSRTVVRHLLLVVAIAIGHALLVLPVLLAASHRLLSWPRGLSNWLGRRDSTARWRRFSTHVVAHYKLYFVLSLLILGALSVPAVRMRLWEPAQSAAPRDADSMKAFEQLAADGWGGQILPVTLLATNPAGSVYEPAFLAWLQQVVRDLEARPEVLRVQALVGTERPLAEYQGLYASLQALSPFGTAQPLQALVNAGSDKTVLYVIPRRPLVYDDIASLLNFSRDYARSHAAYPLLTGGIAARQQDFTHELYRHTGLMLLLIVGGVYGLLWWHMKTLVLPLKAAVMNFLPILAAFGTLTLIFQYGWGRPLLQTPLNGAVSHMVPMVVFCIVFGLSMDYEVLILSRVSEEYRRHGDVREAVIEGLARSGAVITGAVLILLGVFLPGCFSSSPQIQEICIGITAAILLDATVVRLLLVPSFMMLMGKWNWWRPGQADRIP
jgi:RND superfamily putative drug exporter